MNKIDAMRLLNLKDNYSPEELKKNYRKLAMLYHPDKCSRPDANERFSEVQTAYDYLLNGPSPTDFPNFNTDELLKNIFKSFSSKIVNLHGIPIHTSFGGGGTIKKNKILITPLDYFTGTKKSIVLDTNCNCELLLCDKCSGCGYSIDFNVCMKCMGDGWIKSCTTSKTTPRNSKCINKKSIEIVIPSCMKLDGNIMVDYNGSLSEYKVELNDTNYFYENGNMYYHFDISLKESLIGFNKIFKDPFGNIHNIFIKNSIIKQNDGYSLKLKDQYTLILVFNIIYPNKFSKELKEIIEKHF